MSRQAVSRWERDETMLETDKVVMLADWFGVTTDYLMRQQAEEKTAASSAQERKYHWADKLAYLAKTKGYLLGWLLIAWGVTGLLGVLAAVLIANGFFNFTFTFQ